MFIFHPAYYIDIVGLISFPMIRYFNDKGCLQTVCEYGLRDNNINNGISDLFWPYLLEQGDVIEIIVNIDSINTC